MEQTFCSSALALVETSLSANLSSLLSGGGLKEIKLRILELDKERDFAKLQADPHSSHVCLCKLDPSTLKGRSIALCLFQLELQNDLREFDLELTTMTVSQFYSLVCSPMLNLLLE